MLQGLLRPRLKSSTVLLLPLAICQSKSQSAQKQKMGKYIPLLDERGGKVTLNQCNTMYEVSITYL